MTSSSSDTLTFATGSLKASWEHQSRCCIVRATGAPALSEFICFAAWVGQEAEAWSAQRLLVDLRAVSSISDANEQQVVGCAAGVILKNLLKVASVVPEGCLRVQGEKEAQRQGVPLRVFTDYQTAITWMESD